MKRVGKPVAIVVAVICVAAFALSFFGIASRYGDVISKTIYNPADIERGLGFSYDAVSVLRADEDISAEQLQDIRAMLEDRLSLVTLADYDIAVDNQHKAIVLRTAFSENSSYAPYQVASFLAEKGEFTVRVGAEQDEDGRMSGITAEDSSVLLTNDDVKSVQSAYTYYNGVYYYILTLELEKDAATNYANAIQKLIDEGVQSQISCWIDDSTMFYSEALTEITNTTHLQLTSSSWSATQATTYSLYIQSDPLPVGFTYAGGYVAQEPGFGSGVMTAVAVGAALLLVAAGVYLVLRFRVFGACAYICMLGALGALMMVYTGVFTISNAVGFTSYSLAVLVALVALSVERANRMGCELQNELQSPSVSGGRALVKVCSGRIKSSLKVLLPIFFGGMFIYFCFSSNGNFLADAASLISGGFAEKAVSGFGLAAAMAALFSLLFSVLGLELMARSVGSYRTFGDKKWFGGKENG